MSESHDLLTRWADWLKNKNEYDIDTTGNMQMEKFILQLLCDSLLGAIHEITALRERVSTLENELASIDRNAEE